MVSVDELAYAEPNHIRYAYPSILIVARVAQTDVQDLVDGLNVARELLDGLTDCSDVLVAATSRQCYDTHYTATSSLPVSATMTLYMLVLPKNSNCQRSCLKPEGSR